MKAMPINVAEAVAATLVAKGYTARTYPAGKGQYGCVVHVRFRGHRFTIYTPEDVPDVLARLELNRAMPTIVEQLEARDGFQEGERVQPAGQSGPADPLSVNR